MTLRGVFLADGPSDLPLANHLTRLCADVGLDIALTSLNPHELPGAVRRTVEHRLRFVRAQGASTDLIFVHRDAEGQHPDLRRIEIRDGVAKSGIEDPFVPVVPVRMTEAWLLLDESAIREVAGRPHGRTALKLPNARAVEAIADPKELLRYALVTASETSGRRRDNFKRDFDRHRRLLLDRLDADGPVSQLGAWKRLRTDIAEVARQLQDGRTP